MKDGFWLWVLFWVTVSFVAAAGLVVLANWSEKVEVKARCDGFAETSGRETKFVEYSYWSRACLCKMKDGTWLELDQIRAVE